MRVIARRTLRDFWLKHPDAEQPLKAWFAEAEAADWATPAHIKSAYRSASILVNERVVFNIGGNKYRLIARVNYAYRVMYIRFVGTHRQYDAIDAEVI